MTGRLLKAAGAIFLIVFSSFTILASLAEHDAKQALIDQNIHRQVVIQVESAGYGTAGVLALGLSVIFFVLGYQSDRSERKCPQCGDTISRDESVCRFCQR